MKRTASEMKLWNKVYANVKAKYPELSQKAQYMRAKAICEKRALATA